jgi:hypothetical protein
MKWMVDVVDKNRNNILVAVRHMSGSSEQGKLRDDMMHGASGGRHHKVRYPVQTPVHTQLIFRPGANFKVAAGHGGLLDNVDM